MQFTPRRTIGGRAWQSIKLVSEEQEKALVLWGNTSLGMLLRWWHSNKQQAGRGNVGKTAMEGLPILNINALTAQQLEKGVKIFDETCESNFFPFTKLTKTLCGRSWTKGLGEKCWACRSQYSSWVVLLRYCG